MSDIGFHVWNPAGRLPTYTHPTFLAAWAEKDRLQALHPGERFVVMMPCEDMSGIGYGLGFTAGREEARREVDARVRDAWQVADIARADARDLRAKIAALVSFLANIGEHRATVADCLLWFDGFMAAFANDGTREPHVIRRDLLLALNRDLIAIQNAPALASETAPSRNLMLDDQDIPF